MADYTNTRLSVLSLLTLGFAFATAEAATLESSAECSEVTPRAAILRVQWPRSAKASQIDVTVHKDGFTTGRFVSASIADVETAPRAAVPMLPPEDPKAATQLSQALSLRIESVGLRPGALEIEAILGGFIPGLNYYVRIGGTGGEIIRFRAPICPVDFVNPQGELPK